MQPIFIGGAWPYANGSLHIGQIAALLPGDVLARYFRQKGHPVLYVSGSDCHGTPIAVRAARENRQPGEIASFYHQEFTSVFSRLGFSYDCYSRTDQPQHAELVQNVFLTLLKKGLLEKKPVSQVYCSHCRRFLPDRYVEGRCPRCGAQARGDQCDACTAILDPQDLIDPHCKLCGQPTVLRRSDHYFFRLSTFQDALTHYLDEVESGFRINARNETRRYLQENLPDRAATRDLDWGIPVPVPGFSGKSIYVWIDAVLGYLSASRHWSQETGLDWRPFWTENAQAWYVHGKDNIPFHSLILPALLEGCDPGLKKPDHLLSSEYMTLEGRKISTSQNWAIWVQDLLDQVPADSIRYFLLSNNPEKRDADFSWLSFINSHNGELLGALGNLVNRTLQFIKKYRDGVTLNEPCDPAIWTEIAASYRDCGGLLEQGEIKASLERAFKLVRQLNKYFDQTKPWLTRDDDPGSCDRALATCLHGLANLSQLLAPFLPHTCRKIRQDLQLPEEVGWEPVICPCGRILGDIAILFPRLDAGKFGGDAHLCDNKAVAVK